MVRFLIQTELFIPDILDCKELTDEKMIKYQRIFMLIFGYAVVFAAYCLKFLPDTVISMVRYITGLVHYSCNGRQILNNASILVPFLKRWSRKHVCYDIFSWNAFAANKYKRNDRWLYWRPDSTYMFAYWNVLYPKTQVVL